jgi:hypothetical protein
MRLKPPFSKKGFAATSIDELIAAIGITKNGFFLSLQRQERARQDPVGPLRRARGHALQ